MSFAPEPLCYEAAATPRALFKIEWITSVHTAVLTEQPIPEFPLARGPQKPRLIDLERTISLYQIIQKTKSPEFIRHRDNVRATILDRCDHLLADKVS